MVQDRESLGVQHRIQDRALVVRLRCAVVRVFVTHPPQPRLHWCGRHPPVGPVLVICDLPDLVPVRLVHDERWVFAPQLRMICEQSARHRPWRHPVLELLLHLVHRVSAVQQLVVLPMRVSAFHLQLVLPANCVAESLAHWRLPDADLYHLRHGAVFADRRHRPRFRVDYSEYVRKRLRQALPYAPWAALPMLLFVILDLPMLLRRSAAAVASRRNHHLAAVISNALR